MRIRMPSFTTIICPYVYCYRDNAIFQNQVAILYYLCCVCSWVWGHLGVWGELASHRPSSQGWAPECPLIRLNFICIFCPFASYGVWVGITFLFSLYELLCYAHVFPRLCTFRYTYTSVIIMV